MDNEKFREYCLKLPNLSESLPFGPDNLVFKVYDKVFALLSLETEYFRCSLKCNPERAIELRSDYDFIIPGYHTNKKHWNTITNPTPKFDELVLSLTQHSYELVVESVPKSKKMALS